MESINKTFDSCPVCQSTNRFFETLADDLKSRGLVRPNWSHCYDIKEGVIADEATIKSMPIGSELDSYGIKIDICMDCGCVYAIDLRTRKAKVEVRPPQLLVPGGIMPQDPSHN